MTGMKELRSGLVIAVLVGMSLCMSGCSSSTAPAPPLATSELDPDELPAAKDKQDPKAAIPQPKRQLPGREEATTVSN